MTLVIEGEPGQVSLFGLVTAVNAGGTSQFSYCGGSHPFNREANVFRSF
jgi:acyl-CoA hydrolase